MSFIDCLKYYAEFGYFIAGIVLAGAAIYGLQQIRISKSDIEERRKRATMEKAMEYSELFESKFMPLIKIYIEECKKIGFDIRGEYEKLNDFNKSKIERYKTLQKMELQSWLPALNTLESIAASFVLDIADEKTGFLMIGSPFCFAVFKVHDLIVEERESEENVTFMDMTIKLYEKWALRYQEGCFSKDKSD